MPLNEALQHSYEGALEWIEDLAEAERLLTPGATPPDTTEYPEETDGMLGPGM